MSQDQETKKAKRRWRVSRRGFLIGAGVTGGALLLGWRFGVPALRLQLAESFDSAEASFGQIDASPLAWFEITPDNRVRLHMPKVEMGQGIHTALGQVAADELEIAWEQLQVVSADTLAGPVDSFGTVGSFSARTLWDPLRAAAATMKQMLIQAAAVQLGEEPGSLTASAGRVFVSSDPQRGLDYGAIVAAADAWEVPEEAPPLKPPDQFNYIGRSMPRVDFPEKLTGAARYGLDIRQDGMLYGAAAYPPTVAGKLRQAAPGQAGEQPGVVQVVIEEGFAGVVAGSRAQAESALNSLELEWEEGPRLGMAEIQEIVSVGQGGATLIQREGESFDQVEKGGGAVAQTLLAEFRSPLAAHAQLEPQAALVHVTDEQVEAWVSTQMPQYVQRTLADALDRPAEEIKVNAMYVGGGFGRKAGTEVAVEAALLSRASGRPVHVGWTRPKEFRAGYLRPPTHHILRGALTADGRIQALEHQQASADVAFLSMPAFFPILAGADFGATRGARFIYGVPNLRSVAWRTKLPFATGWWRGLGLLANTFAIESFMDELAHAAAADPLEFRLRHLPQGDRGRRLGEALQRAAEMAGWPQPAPAGRARGLAACIDAGTVVAQVAEISLEGTRPRVHRVSCVVDPGLPINPDGVAAQAQGSIIMGLSSVFIEQITVEDGRIRNTNFDSYPLITMKETPDIEVEVRRSGDRPYGVGEPPIGPIAAATANAIFKLTGQRLRSLPLQLSG